MKQSDFLYFAEHEHKLLLRQAPVNYLTDGTIYKGFNQYGELAVIYDSYDNTVALEYEDYDLTESGEKYRISALVDNDDNRITFEYNDDGLLTAITDKRGRRTKYTYNTAKYLTKVEYANGKTIEFSYTTDGDIKTVETSDKYYSEIMYSSSKLSTIRTYSLTTEILYDEANSVAKSDNTILEQWQISHPSLAKTTITLREKSGAISDENKAENIIEYYIFNSDGNNTEYYLEEYGKVTKAEKYTYKAYVSDKTETAQKSKLNVCAYTDNFDFGNADYEEVILDQFNNPKTSTKFNYISDTNSVTAVTTYTYNDDHKCEKTKTVTRVVADGVEKVYTGIIKHNYNAQGKVVRAESYIEGEEYLGGINIEEVEFDEKGRAIRSFTYNSLDSSSKFYTESEYAENGQTLAELDDTGEYKTEFEYVDNTNVVRSKKLPNGSKFSYGYDIDDTVTSISQSTEEGEENSTNTRYTCDMVTELVSGNNKVQYEYDYKRRKTKVNLNGEANYVKYSYADNISAIVNGTSKTVNKVKATYIKRNDAIAADVFTTLSDLKGNVVQTSYNGTVQSEWEYDADNKLELYTDKIMDRSVSYSYDALDRMDTYTEKSGSTELVKETYDYDDYGSLSSKTITGEVSHTYKYKYKQGAAHTLESVAFDTLKVMPKTDVNGRNIGKEIYVSDEKKAEEIITYRKVGDHATNMPAAVWFGNVVKGSYMIRDNVKYAYDKMGNICKVYENGEMTIRYTYDKLSRLVREDNKRLGKTWVYAYDHCGNIIRKRYFDYTLCDTDKLEELTATDTILYGYDGDRLMYYGSETLVYDKMGNPMIYRGKEANWNKGRQLQSYGGTNFTYDSQGRRLSKGNITYCYDSNGRLIKQSDGLEFIYDNAGVIGVKYKGVTYIYRKDAQGNIVALLDSDGNVVVRYIYDAWGNNEVRATNAACVTLANLNPFRYRGYYYDVETGLFLVSSRYYDPETGRFISPDDISYLDPSSINGLNLYAYCGNDPVNRWDPTGHAWEWNTFWTGLGMVVTAIGAIALAVTTFGAGIPLAMSIVAGVTLGAGVLTGINGVATMIEAGTQYNFVRDGVFNGLGWSDSAYNVYAGIVEGVAVVGSMVLGFYHTTGQYKAARYGQKYLGKGYKKVGYTNSGTPRYVSKDGLRQMRFDNPHMYKGKMIGKHLNLEFFKGTKPVPYEHVLYSLFKYWII